MPCAHEDIAIAGTRMMSPVIELRTLLPIKDVLADSHHFNLVSSVFSTGARLNITRFNNDAFDAVVEFLPDVIVDIEGAGRVKLYPRQEPILSGIEPERGWKLAERDGYFVLRHGGRTVERFKD